MAAKQQQQKKAARSQRCKSLLMLSSPFSGSTGGSVKSSFLSLLNPNQSNQQQQDLHSVCQTGDLRQTPVRGQDGLRRFASSDNDLAGSAVFGLVNFNSSEPTSGLQQAAKRNKRAVKMKLFEQPLDKLFSPKAMKQLNLAINGANNNHSPETGNKRNKRFSNSGACLRKFSSINSTDANNNNNSQQDQTLNQFKRQQLLLSVIPEPIRNLLNELYQRGPSTVGIFRKSPNAKHCRDLRQKLETDSQSSIEQFQVTVIASVFKVSNSIFCSSFKRELNNNTHTHRHKHIL